MSKGNCSFIFFLNCFAQYSRYAIFRNANLRLGVDKVSGILIKEADIFLRPTHYVFVAKAKQRSANLFAKVKFGGALLQKFHAAVIVNVNHSYL